MRGQRRSHRFTRSGRCQSPLKPPNDPFLGGNRPGLALSCQTQCPHFSILLHPDSPSLHPHISIPAVTSFNVPISPSSPLSCQIQHSHLHIPISLSPHPQACSFLEDHSGLAVQGELPAWSFTCIPALLPVYIHPELGIFSIWILAAARPCSGCECKCLWVSQPGQGTHSRWPWLVPSQDTMTMGSLLMPPCSVPLCAHASAPPAKAAMGAEGCSHPLDSPHSSSTSLCPW